MAGIEGFPDGNRGNGSANDAARRWLRCFARQPAASLRLVCFPHAGGAASFFFPWAKPFSPTVEVWAIRYPGREDRPAEEPLAGIEAMAGEIAHALTALADRPAVLFGHSMGALGAFETARHRDRLVGGAPVTRLIASSSPAPVRAGLARIRGTDDASLRRDLRQGGGTSDAVLDHPELLEIVIETLRADYRRLNGYRPLPGATTGAPITVIGGSDDPAVDDGDLAAWQAHTTSTFERHMFPGGHFHLADTLPAIVALVTRELAS